jgi:hypothetical protein
MEGLAGLNLPLIFIHGIRDETDYKQVEKRKGANGSLCQDIKSSNR